MRKFVSSGRGMQARSASCKVPRIGEQVGGRPFLYDAAPYMTATRSTMLAITPRSWVMSTRAMSRSSASRSSS